MKLSIVIPALNEERTLPAVLESVLASPYHTEVIVVDDGSTDSTPAILEEFSARNTASSSRAIRGGAARARRYELGLPRRPAMWLSSRIRTTNTTRKIGPTCSTLLKRDGPTRSTAAGLTARGACFFALAPDRQLVGQCAGECAL